MPSWKTLISAWLATAEEKAAHLKALIRIDQLMLPHVTAGEGERRAARYFPERLPIGIYRAGRGVLVYVVADPWLDEFRMFLERHAVLVRALPAWTLRTVVPPQLPGVGDRAEEVVRNQLLTPLPLEVIDELRWNFEQVRSHPNLSMPRPRRAVLQGPHCDSAPRFKALYRCGSRTATWHSRGSDRTQSKLP